MPQLGVLTQVPALQESVVQASPSLHSAAPMQPPTVIVQTFPVTNGMESASASASSEPGYGSIRTSKVVPGEASAETSRT